MKKKPSAINIIWLSMIVIATVTAAYTGKMANVTNAMFLSAKSAVTLAIALVGPMALWFGAMKVVEAGGLMRMIARAISPVMRRLFPDVPTDHPAMSAIIMNMAANALGLTNAATPMGLKAMKELDTLNPEKGTATNAMCLFLAINTSNVAILPLGVITIRAVAGSSSPAAIMVPSLIATSCSTIVAIIAAKLLERKSANLITPEPVDKETKKESKGKIENTIDKLVDEIFPPGIFSKIFILLLIAAFIGGIVFRISKGNFPPLFGPQFFSSLSNWLMPMLLCSLLLFGFFKGIKVYEALTEGGKEGFSIAIRIIPFMVAIFVAIGMFRESGALDIFIRILNPVTSLIGMPAEALQVALLRPLSGSGSFGVMAEIVNNNPDSFLSFLVSTMQGSTETTFYVLAVYFGSISIKRSRHALPAGLCADAAGAIAAVFICRLMF
jgi:spore maturation protein SpmA